MHQLCLIFRNDIIDFQRSKLLFLLLFKKVALYDVLKSDKEQEEHSKPDSKMWGSNRTQLYEIARNNTCNYEAS